MNFIAKSAGNTDSNIGFWTEAVGGSPTEKLRITSDGKFCLGTINATPSAGVHIDIDTNNMLMLDNSTASTQKIFFANNASTHAQIYGTTASGALTLESDPDSTHSNSYMSLTVDGVEALRANNVGRVNIGGNFANPGEKLTVVGNISMGTRGDNVSRYIGKGTNSTTLGTIGDASSNGNSSWIGFVSGTGTGYEDQIRFGTHQSGVSGGERMRITGAGKILIPGTQTVSDQTGMLDIYHTAPVEIDSPHIRLWGPTNQDARIEFGSETNVGEGAFISYNDSDEGLWIGSRMSGYAEVNICTGMNDGSPHTNARLSVNSVGRSSHMNTTEFNREAYTKGGTVYGGGAATGANNTNPGAYTFVNATPVRGSNTRYSFWVQSSDAYPNASNYLDFTVANAAMYRVLIKGSNSSATADIAQFLIYGLANSGGNLAPVIEQVTTSAPSFNGDSGGSADFHKNSGSFSCIVMGYGASGGTRGSTGTYDTTLRIQYSGGNNQGLVAFIERWDSGT